MQRPLDQLALLLNSVALVTVPYAKLSFPLAPLLLLLCVLHYTHVLIPRLLEHMLLLKILLEERLLFLLEYLFFS